MDRQHARERQRQSPDDAAETDDDQAAIDEGRKQYLAQLRRDVALQHVADRVELGVVRVADEVEDALAHNLAAHGHEQGEVEHVACADEPVHENGRDRVVQGEEKPRLERRLGKQWQQGQVEQHAAVQRKDEHLDADDQDDLHDPAGLVQPVDEGRFPLLRRLGARERGAAAQVEACCQRHGDVARENGPEPVRAAPVGEVRVDCAYGFGQTQVKDPGARVGGRRRERLETVPDGGQDVDGDCERTLDGVAPAGHEREQLPHARER